MSESQQQFSKHELAAVLGVTQRQIERLVVERVIPRLPGGDFDLGAITAYVAYQRRGAGVNEARRQELIAKTVDRKLRTRTMLARTATDDESEAFRYLHVSRLPGLLGAG